MQASGDLPNPTPALFGQYTLANLPLAHSFADLPAAFYTPVTAQALPSPYLVATSQQAADLIGLHPTALAEADFTEIFTGNRTLPGMQTVAAVYSGHQFGVWAGQLGDGRALLLGEVNTPDGAVELQLKGSGKTPYSRMGDGRAVLRSSIREFLCSEAMAALGIPTSRALCITGSDYPIFRETTETAAVVTRMAKSFVRFGSFEHWFYKQQPQELQILTDYVIANFYPDLRDAENPALALLGEVTRRTASLIAQWQAVGFMHGVMNTDNMSILGITIDYGPFGFMESFDAGHICNHSDSQGRYSFQMQPQIGHWNCYALAQALLPLIGNVDLAREALESYGNEFSQQMDDLQHAKLGLQCSLPEDTSLIKDMYAMLQEHGVDYTLFFRRLSRFALDEPASVQAVAELFIDPQAFAPWAANYAARLRQENQSQEDRHAQQLACNPKYVLRNYLAQIAIEKAMAKDFSGVTNLLTVLQKPFDEQPEYEKYAALPPDWARKLEVSCSS